MSPKEKVMFHNAVVRPPGPDFLRGITTSRLGPPVYEKALAIDPEGLDEQQVFIGDTWHFADLVLRVTEPRQPCSKFNAVMGYDQAGRDMVQSGRCGFYLAVDTPGTLSAGESFVVQPGEQAISMADALRHKARKHLR